MAYLLDRLEVNTGQYTHYLDIYWQSNSSATNQSYLRIVQWIRRTTSPTYGAFGGSPGFSWSNTVNGSASSGTSGSFDFRSVQDITVSDRYLYVTHTTDGTKSISISLSKDYWTAGFPAASGSKSVVLPTIPLSTQPTLSSSTVAVGSSVTINLSGRASGSFTHNISYDFGSLTSQTSGLSASTGVGTSATFTPPASLLPQMIGLSSQSATIRVTTWNGGTQVGTAKTVVLNLTPPGGVIFNAPSVGATVQRALSDGTPADDGVCLRVNISAAVSSVVIGTQQNALRYKVRTRPLGGGSWFELTNTLVAGITFTGQRTFTDSSSTGGTQPFLTTNSYEVEVEASDSFGQVRTWAGILAPASALLAIHRPTSSVSIGQLYDSGLGGELQVHGERVALGPYEREVVSASIAVNATWQGTVAIGRPAFTAVKVTTSSPARVRIHASAAHRTADLSRTSAVAPSGNHGVLLDVTTDSSPLEVNPTMLGGSLEAVPSASFPITVQRLAGSTGALTVTLTVI